MAFGYYELDVFLMTQRSLISRCVYNTDIWGQFFVPFMFRPSNKVFRTRRFLLRYSRRLLGQAMNQSTFTLSRACKSVPCSVRSDLRKNAAATDDARIARLHKTHCTNCIGGGHGSHVNVTALCERRPSEPGGPIEMT